MSATAVALITAGRPVTNNNENQDTKQLAKTQQEYQEALLGELLANDASYQASGIETTIRCALNIQRAKKELKGAHLDRFKVAMKHDSSDISVYLRIAENQHITNPDNWQYLPSGPTILVILARYTMKMTPGEFNQLTTSMKIHPAIKRSEARELAGLKSKPVRTTLAPANKADHVDCSESLAMMPHSANTSALAAPVSDSPTMHSLAPQATKSTYVSSVATADNNIVFGPDLEHELAESVKRRARNDVNEALRNNGLSNRNIIIQ